MLLCPLFVCSGFTPTTHKPTIPNRAIKAEEEEDKNAVRTKKKEEKEALRKKNDKYFSEEFSVAFYLISLLIKIICCNC